MIGDRFRATEDPFLGNVLEAENALTALGTSGRGEAWSYIINNLPPGFNWWGQGAGQSSYLADEILGIDHPHNEYLRIFYDFGWAGLGLFLVGTLVLFLSVFSRWRRDKSDIALAASLSIVAVALLSVTDNPVIYIFVMFPLAVVISAALATASSENPKVADSQPHRMDA
jgi:O-antigen ligase